MYKFTMNNEEIILDDTNLQFSEANLNDFLVRLPALYAYYSQKWAEAQHEHFCAEDQYESLYSAKFEIYKSDKASDKLAEARTMSDKDVMEAKNIARKAKFNMQSVYGYLKSLDKAHENALNLGYNLRKEMDKIHPGIKSASVRDYDKELQSILSED